MGRRRATGAEAERRSAEARAEAEAEAAAAWEWAGQFAKAPPGLSTRTCLGFVRTIRQPARTGAKAYVEWYPHHEVIAAWFPDAWPPEGAYVVATGRLSHGAHHEETVFYVDRGELRITPNYAPEAYERRRRLRPDAIDSNG